MERRSFLINSSKLGMSAVASSVLLGCGSGSGVTTSTVQSLSEIDNKIVSFDTTQTELDNIHTDIQNNLNFTDANIKNFYANTFPGVPSSDSQDVDPILSNNYLAYLKNDKNLWQNAQSAHDIAYQQYKHQYTKMKATLRLFDYKQSNSEDVPLQTKVVDSSERRAKILKDDTLATLLNLTEINRSEKLAIDTLSLIEPSLKIIFDTLNSSLENDSLDVALTYADSVYLIIEEILTYIKDIALTNLNFTTSTDIMISLAKITVGAIAILGLVALKFFDLTATGMTDGASSISSFLYSNKLDSKVSSLWIDISSKITLSTIDEMKKNVKLSVETGDIPDNTELITNLESKSKFLAITAAAIKRLSVNSLNDAITLTQNEVSNAAFNNDSTADKFKILFGSEKNPYDQLLNTMMNDPELTASTGDQSLSDSLNQNFKLSLFDTQPEMTQTETDAYNFALQLATFAYNFTSATEGDAAYFARHMAELAYGFTMDIEEDAYQFALQGMEWGYLFASNGEEVGLMADRILWMAVQIGVMADRIGEMADRIVYTEQLIVYTEILILDFGILIYGFGSQITNLILTGMALILDREWYTPDSNSIVLDTINNNVMTMLASMQEYALAVLEHQNELREWTLLALDPLPYADTEPV